MIFFVASVLGMKMSKSQNGWGKKVATLKAWWILSCVSILLATNVDDGSSGSSAERAVVVGGCFGRADAILELVKANDGIISNISVNMELNRVIMLFLSCTWTAIASLGLATAWNCDSRARDRAPSRHWRRNSLSFALLIYPSDRHHSLMTHTISQACLSCFWSLHYDIECIYTQKTAQTFVNEDSR